jgi:hypothetical protein
MQDPEFGWDDITDEYNPLEPNDIMHILEQQEALKKEEQKQRFIESLRRTQNYEEPMDLKNESAEEAYQRRLKMAGITNNVKFEEHEEVFEESSSVVCIENFKQGISASEIEMQVARACSFFGEILHCFVHTSPSSNLKAFVQFADPKNADNGTHAFCFLNVCLILHYLASKKLNQTLICGCKVSIELFDEEDFNNNQLDS